MAAKVNGNPHSAPVRSVPRPYSPRGSAGTGSRSPGRCQRGPAGLPGVGALSSEDTGRWWEVHPGEAGACWALEQLALLSCTAVLRPFSPRAGAAPTRRGSSPHSKSQVSLLASGGTHAPPERWRGAGPQRPVPASGHQPGTPPPGGVTQPPGASGIGASAGPHRPHAGERRESSCTQVAAVKWHGLQRGGWRCPGPPSRLFLSRLLCPQCCGLVTFVPQERVSKACGT